MLSGSYAASIRQHKKGLYIARDKNVQRAEQTTKVRRWEDAHCLELRQMCPVALCDARAQWDKSDNFMCCK